MKFFNGWKSALIFTSLLGLVAIQPLLAQVQSLHRKVIIDQDALGPGGSNMQAILLALQAPDVDVLGITVVSGDGWRDENVAHTLRLLELVGRTDVPVVPGATFPLLNTKLATERWEAIHGKLFYKGAWMDEYPHSIENVKRAPGHGPFVVPPLEEGAPTTKAADETAAGFMIRMVHKYPGEVSILVLGPATDVALAVRLDDRFASLAKELVVMGGSYSPKAANNDFALEYIYTPRLEFNFRWDPEATRILLRAPWKKIVQVPIDPTTKTFFSPALVKQIAAADTPVTRYIAKYAQGFPMWDELAVGVWLDPKIATRTETLAVDADVDADGAGYGNTVCWAAGHGPGLGERDVEVVFDVDVKRFEDDCVEYFKRAAKPDAP